VTTGVTTPPPTYSDEGSVMLLVSAPEFNDPQLRMTLTGVFTETRRGWINLAQCLAVRDDTLCLSELPEQIDDYVDGAAYDEDIPASMQFIDIGTSFSLGAYSAGMTDIVGETEIFSVYHDGTLAQYQGLPVGGMDLSFSGGAWATWTGNSVVQAPEPIIVVSPDPLRENLFPIDGNIHLEWEVSASGSDVMVAVQSPGLKRLYRLEDDGEHDLDLSDFPLVDDDQLDLAFGRWSTSTVDYDGNDIEVHAISQQMIRGKAVDQSGRTEVVPVETCADADLLPAHGTGMYFGEITNFANDINLGYTGCTGYPTQGQDGYLRITVDPDAVLLAKYRLLSDDASFYLLDTCGAPQTCLVGADATLNNDWETLSWTNNSPSPADVYLSLDSWGNSTGVFELDLVLSETDVLVNSCTEAIGMPPLTTGFYLGDISAYDNLTDPYGTYCDAAPGADALAPVALLDGETLSANLTMLGDAVVYLLYNCSISASCATSGAGTNTASLSYTNTAGASETVYLVIDSASTSGSYTLDVLIQ
jgi:hypothetical protein